MRNIFSEIEFLFTRFKAWRAGTVVGILRKNGIVKVYDYRK